MKKKTTTIVLAAALLALTGCRLLGPMPKNSANFKFPDGSQWTFVHELNTYVTDVGEVR